MRKSTQFLHTVKEAIGSSWRLSSTKVYPTSASSVALETGNKPGSLQRWLYARYRNVLIPAFVVLFVVFMVCFALAVSLVVVGGSSSMNKDTEAAIELITEQCAQSITSYFDLLKTNAGIQAKQWLRALNTPRVIFLAKTGFIYFLIFSDTSSC